MENFKRALLIWLHEVIMLLHTKSAARKILFFIILLPNSIILKLQTNTDSLFTLSAFIISLDLLIEVCHGLVNVRSQPEITNAQSEYAQDAPTDESQHQEEEFPLVTIHHLCTEAQHLVRTELRIVTQDILYQSQAQAHPEARDYEQAIKQDLYDGTENQCKRYSTEIVIAYKHVGHIKRIVTLGAMIAQEGLH